MLMTLSTFEVMTTELCVKKTFALLCLVLSPTLTSVALFKKCVNSILSVWESCVKMLLGMDLWIMDLLEIDPLLGCLK